MFAGLGPIFFIPKGNCPSQSMLLFADCFPPINLRVSIEELLVSHPILMSSENILIEPYFQKAAMALVMSCKKSICLFVLINISLRIMGLILFSFTVLTVGDY